METASIKPIMTLLIGLPCHLNARHSAAYIRLHKTESLYTR